MEALGEDLVFCRLINATSLLVMQIQSAMIQTNVKQFALQITLFPRELKLVVGVIAGQLLWAHA